MGSRQNFTIVFAVCHPDDESIWCGGLAHELSKFDFIKTYVVCLSGNDSNSPRISEFEAACRAGGFAGQIIMGSQLRLASIPLPDMSKTLSDGLATLGIDQNDINLLITHAPFGDEHLNPHHRQAYLELRKWAVSKAVPFGHFACAQLPNIQHTSCLAELRQRNTFRILQFSKCSSHWFDRVIGTVTFRPIPQAKYYLQFLTDVAAKRNMTQAYQSIDIPAHEAGYTMFSNPCEGLYLLDEKGLAVFDAVRRATPVISPNPLIDTCTPLQRAMRKIRRIFMTRG